MRCTEVAAARATTAADVREDHAHLNTFDPVLSIQHKFDGKLRRQRKHTQDFTSLALFRDDVECLLRDLYGDVESDALDSVLWAVFRIVEQFAKFVRPDLSKEHRDAEKLDYMLGIGVPDGYGISGSEWRRGMAAKADLFHRVREVKANPSTFSEYTMEFAKLFAERWDCSKGYEFSPASDFLEAHSSERPGGDIVLLAGNLGSALRKVRRHCRSGSCSIPPLNGREAVPQWPSMSGAPVREDGAWLHWGCLPSFLYARWNAARAGLCRFGIGVGSTGQM